MRHPRPIIASGTYSSDISHADLTTIITTGLEIRPYTHLYREYWANQETRMLLENKNAIIYGTGGSIGGAVVRTFADVTSGTFLGCITPASMTTQVKER